MSGARIGLDGVHHRQASGGYDRVSTRSQPKCRQMAHQLDRPSLIVLQEVQPCRDHGLTDILNPQAARGERLCTWLHDQLNRRKDVRVERSRHQLIATRLVEHTCSRLRPNASGSKPITVASKQQKIDRCLAVALLGPGYERSLKGRTQTHGPTSAISLIRR